MEKFNTSEAKTVMDFKQDFPIFDSLLELEEDTKNKEEMKDQFMDTVLDFGQIEQEFSKIHILVDNLFQNEDDLKPQNSYLFQVKISLILSSMVQMKNTLVKYLDYEVEEPSTQVPIIDYNHELTSVLTPESVSFEQNQTPLNQEYLNLMIFHDDSSFVNFTTKSLVKKGVKIVDFPQYYDIQTVVPFLLLNDHSIILVRNPKKDIFPILKSIMRNGVIIYKPTGEQPRAMKVNITIWVFFDIQPWLVKLTKKGKPN